MAESRRPRTALCLADLHSSASALSRLDGLLGRLAGRLTVSLIAGDVTIPGHEAYARDVIAVHRRHGVPLLLVHGNNDSPLAVEEFRRAGVTIHRRTRDLDGLRFVGFGGDGTAPHDVELGPDETLALDPSHAILVTHLPPPGLRYGPDTGPPPDPPHRPAPARRTRPALDPALEALAPRAQLCGHIHQLEGVAWLGPTKVVKPRAAMWNRCALLDLDTLRATFLDLDPAAPLRRTRVAPPGRR